LRVRRRTLSACPIGVKTFPHGVPTRLVLYIAEPDPRDLRACQRHNTFCCPSPRDVPPAVEPSLTRKRDHRETIGRIYGKPEVTIRRVRTARTVSLPALQHFLGPFPPGRPTRRKTIGEQRTPKENRREPEECHSKPTGGPSSATAARGGGRPPGPAAGPAARPGPARPGGGAENPKMAEIGRKITFFSRNHRKKKLQTSREKFS